MCSETSIFNVFVILSLKLLLGAALQSNTTKYATLFVVNRDIYIALCYKNPYDTKRASKICMIQKEEIKPVCEV